ncbi:hypothetical protein Skr01_73840 [Sphaerisporangium krabiense]|uniref:DUF4352 domain-containing protein n=1 Tax=Sphaerisporangium krabiense TaxID=763782 RepID=A0A7W9DN82_9ACTN|nr:hypothetical protein [Sphaerisporangium krabiense]MBB5625102.1 hypothetical protein [Sphaerisporangium krabiense]GII67299.1 hypothetical protein Skr01_73840 [Sphaerisporangium krabiense]
MTEQNGTVGNDPVRNDSVWNDTVWNGAEDDTATWDAFTPVNRTAPPPEPSPPPLPPEPPARPPARRIVRGMLLAVAAVALAAVTVGVQWADRAAWIADRYPDEAIKDVGRGGTGALHGMSWGAALAVQPPPPGGVPGVTTLLATVRMTPASAEAVRDYLTPRFEVRDRAGHRWEALPANTPLSSDLAPGRQTWFQVVSAVPETVSGTAELVLTYSPAETLRFAR